MVGNFRPPSEPATPAEGAGFLLGWRLSTLDPQGTRTWSIPPAVSSQRGDTDTALACGAAPCARAAEARARRPAQRGRVTTRRCGRRPVQDLPNYLREPPSGSAGSRQAPP